MENYTAGDLELIVSVLKILRINVEWEKANCRKIRIAGNNFLRFKTCN